MRGGGDAHTCGDFCTFSTLGARRVIIQRLQKRKKVRPSLPFHDLPANGATKEKKHQEKKTHFHYFSPRAAAPPSPFCVFFVCFRFHTTGF